MNGLKEEDVKAIALKLDKIHSCSPEDYWYIKGWIHCLLQTKNTVDRQPRKPPG